MFITSNPASDGAELPGGWTRPGPCYLPVGGRQRSQPDASGNLDAHRDAPTTPRSAGPSSRPPRGSIREKGYEGTSVQEIADACGLTKAGLYHHIQSKEQLLIEIMNYGMDVFEERVLSEVEHIADPVERLKACMARNISS